jgi:hypothetical protein
MQSIDRDVVQCMTIHMANIELIRTHQNIKLNDVWKDRRIGKGTGMGFEVKKGINV